MAEDKIELDDALYSRQRYVLGDSAMKRMATSNVFLHGLGGVGIEAAKNIALAGVKSLTLNDTTNVSWMDLATQFFVGEDDLGRNRAEASEKKVAELNPHTTVASAAHELTTNTDLSFLKEFQAVVVTECPIETQIAVNEYCHANKIPFVAADVRGVFASLFVDCGPEFEVVDSTGEELREFFVSSVTQAAEGLVTTIEHHMHGLQDGDRVKFSEVGGMVELNDTTHPVKIVTPYQFTIGDTEGFSAYETGGMCTQLHRKEIVAHSTLKNQFDAPTLNVVDYAKMEAPARIHLAFQTYHKFVVENGRSPVEGDLTVFHELAKSLSEGKEYVQYCPEVIAAMCCTSRGSIAPLTAAIGGWVGQETLKALTGKFAPLKQWLHIDCMEVLPAVPVPCSEPSDSRMDAQRVCLGEELCQKLAAINLFMIGCGAIGCELLKNFSLLGVSTAAEGMITITDNDLIEKSNLNRQFLFRPHHIRQPKSTTAAAAAKGIHPDVRIKAHQHKVGNENDFFDDVFFEKQDVVVNALDNLTARLFVDSRCVATKKPLLESGTMGAKGHVQVIVPHLTENYASQRDPPEKQIPYCTLKSFPSSIEHTIQWAREKFSNLFEAKPNDYNKFWTENGSPKSVCDALIGGDCGQTFSTARTVGKLLERCPTNYSDCVALARVKFEKYFNHKARQLLASFPLDTKLQDGSLFWTSPKRPPAPLNFTIDDPMHVLFIRSAAQLFAEEYGVLVTAQDTSDESLKSILESISVPEFRAKDKKIETDENAARPKEEAEQSLDDFSTYGSRIKAALGEKIERDAVEPLSVAMFEKDDDSNGHIDFITAASNCRAAMYNIAPADRLKTKKIAGKIVPAIATTTSVVSGLVSAELIKLVKSSKLEDYKNCFLNLALPMMILSEPAEVVKQKLPGGQTLSIWDRWEIHGTKTTTLEEFLALFQEKYKMEATALFNGSAMVYMQFLPGQAKLKATLLRKLVKLSKKSKHIDLTVTVPGEPNEHAVTVRFFQSK